MCGIFGYTGKRDAEPILVDGLKTLEYRGYDSAGLVGDSGIYLRTVGGVDDLSLELKNKSSKYGRSGISHTRWATHGVPSKANAHPHVDCSRNIYVVHNGIIENYQELKKHLVRKGHVFRSETDSEVIAHLIEDATKSSESFAAAVTAALGKLRGTYGLAVLSKKEKGTLIVARMGSPIVIGIGDGEYFIASDPSALLRYTKKVMYLMDGDVAVLTPESHTIQTHNNTKVKRTAEEIEGTSEEIKKSGFAHFMEKEIMDGPEVVRNTIRGRVLAEEGDVKLGGLGDVADRLRDIERIIIVGCGTAYYAGLIGEYMLEEYAKIPVEVEIASEFRYRSPIIDKKTAILAISQSGETADTLAAIREGKKRGALTLGIVNVVGSSVARETDAGVYNHAGPEVSVASTKAFISQVTALALLTVFLGRQRGLSRAEGKEITEELVKIPDKIASILKQRNKIQAMAKAYSGYRDFLYIGRRYTMPIALEGALKLKEVSYIHAEGYGAGEMKHGPLAMIDGNFPTMAIVLKDSVYDKMVSNIEEIRARGGKVIALVTEKDAQVEALADDVISIPKTIEMLSPILATVPLQLFAYYVAQAKGLNIDRPRNLAKSVTVE